MKPPRKKESGREGKFHPRLPYLPSKRTSQPIKANPLEKSRQLRDNEILVD
jgi:hypothetical protein